MDLPGPITVLSCSIAHLSRKAFANEPWSLTGSQCCLGLVQNHPDRDERQHDHMVTLG